MVASDMTQSLSAQNLTGIWHGLYSYRDGRPSVSFVATLIETGSLVSGTTHEQGDRKRGLNQTLYATLLGRRQGVSVTFLKTYERAGPRYYSAVAYEGTLSGDGIEIEGGWLIPGNSSGRFLMIRSAGKEEAVRRKAFERA
jgi:hypothetical protein